MAHSNYADRDIDSSYMQTSPLRLGGFLNPGGARKFDPSNGTAISVSGPKLHFLPEELDLRGDWSWKPARNKLFPQFEMPPLRGVSPARGAAETFRSETFLRS